VRQTFERFVDVRALSDQAVVDLAREMEIDIAVDLMGFTKGGRTDIFAHRAAPVQAAYLGYPGTMGAPYIDYIIADSLVIPAGAEPDYSEKIVRLPGSYQVNDRNRPIAGRTFTRAGQGLPDTGFVFCCFNNTFKITPDVFALWMRILARTDGSVLWLYAENAEAAANLRREAATARVDPQRLHFAEHLPMAEHLARQRLGDLFLDTLPYNGHATASLALWSGLPVLTRIGDSFAGRVAASLLHAIGLPDLVTTTAQDYEALAVALAASPDRLHALRARLEANRLTTPLFDTARFARHLEAAFEAMHARALAGLPPADLRVDG
jgi:predicted O-linked N-acetylglucosamine transferase (SPINDLY family)